MPIFSDAELTYLAAQRLGRLATVQPGGTLQVSPVGFTYNAELTTIDIHGYQLSASRKFRNIADNGRVAFVVDDIPSVGPWQVRCLEIRGRGEAIIGTGTGTGTGTETETGPRGLDDAVIRIHPERIISFGIDITGQEPHAMTPHNRDVPAQPRS
jgi:pyridoxamine 5'-phosphate oxidase family protein